MVTLFSSELYYSLGVPLLVSQSRFCRSLFWLSKREPVIRGVLLTTLPWVRILSVLSSEQRLSQFYITVYITVSWNTVFLYITVLLSRLQIIPQLTLLSASSHYAGTVFRFQISMSVSSRPSRLCRFTAAYLFLASLVGHDLVSKPISLRYRGGPDRNRFRNLWITTTWWFLGYVRIWCRWC